MRALAERSARVKDCGDRIKNEPRKRKGGKVETGPSRRALWVKGYPIPGVLQSVRKRLIAKELGETAAFKCEASVRKE
jgi:hypothetical protein